MTSEELNLVTLAQRFADEDAARSYLEELRWAGGVPVCPFCGSEGGKLNRKPSVGRKAQKGVCKCKNKECRKQFTVTKGTVFESSHVGINLWMMCMFIMYASKKGVSAHQLHRILECQYKTAWFLAHRIRVAAARLEVGDEIEQPFERAGQHVVRTERGRGGFRKGLRWWQPT